MKLYGLYDTYAAGVFLGLGDWNRIINCWHEVPTEDDPPGHVIRYNYITRRALIGCLLGTGGLILLALG
ncbi:MAG: hypothetical protein O2923_09075 [Verrucomicrobia bacterium]|nr:hypothetical protein [Verrucomicrobiota bacterium]MDA1087860.1 hypothetical protein [Verrucomicrobiota bacterium]